MDKYEELIAVFQRHLSNQGIIILPICTKWAMYLYSDCMKEIVHRTTQ